MLYRTLKRMIERGQTANLADKLDIFFATGRITEEEYTELTGMLKEKKQGENGIRHLREVKLWEVSVVTWAMNQEAVITDYKQLGEDADRATKLVADVAADIKAGRKISGARLKALQDAQASMKAAVKALDGIIAEVQDNDSQKARRAPQRASKSASAGTTIEIIL